MVLIYFNLWEKMFMDKEIKVTKQENIKIKIRGRVNNKKNNLAQDKEKYWGRVPRSLNPIGVGRILVMPTHPPSSSSPPSLTQ